MSALLKLQVPRTVRWRYCIAPPECRRFTRRAGRMREFDSPRSEVWDSGVARSVKGNGRRMQHWATSWHSESSFLSLISISRLPRLLYCQPTRLQLIPRRPGALFPMMKFLLRLTRSVCHSVARGTSSAPFSASTARKPNHQTTRRDHDILLQPGCTLTGYGTRTPSRQNSPFDDHHLSRRFRARIKASVWYTRSPQCERERISAHRLHWHLGRSVSRWSLLRCWLALPTVVGEIQNRDCRGANSPW